MTLTSSYTDKTGANKPYFIIYMSLLMFLILLVANLLRNIKDSFITVQIGVETISYIRVILEIPITLGIAWLLKVLSQKLNKVALFGALTAFYFIFLALFVLVIMPYHAHLKLPYLLNMTSLYPNWKWCFKAFAYWHDSISFILFDLWPVLAYTYFFWELSNRIVLFQQAAHIYPRYYLIGQANLVFSGIIIIFCTSGAFSNLSLLMNSEVYISCLIFIVMAILIVIFILYYVISENYAVNSQLTIFPNNFDNISFNFIYAHAYLRNIFIALVCYYAGICIIEAVCLHILKQGLITSFRIARVQGIALIATGLLTISTASFVSSVIRHIGWYRSMTVLPYVLTGLGVFFIIVLMNFKDVSKNYTCLLCLGLGIHVLSKVLKYTLYDVTKEITYIPFSECIKSQGKIVTDTLATSVGKVIGNILQVIVFSTSWCASYEDVLVYLCVFLIIIFLVWMSSLKSLYINYTVCKF